MTTPKQNKDALGKGIRSLLQTIDADLKTTSGTLKSNVVEAVTTMQRIAVDEVEANPKQPRRDFDEQGLNELATSIRLHDLVQPVTVSKLPNGKFRLISGERRWRAAKLAGLKDIPAYVRQANDQQLLELALLENLQREDLNAMEIALSYKRMMEELNHTQEQVAERMGKERSTVANYIRLLRLPPDIQVVVRKGELSMGHARALLTLDSHHQIHIANTIVDKGLSVREAEKLDGPKNPFERIAFLHGILSEYVSKDLCFGEFDKDVYDRTFKSPALANIARIATHNIRGTVNKIGKQALTILPSLKKAA